MFKDLGKGFLVGLIVVVFTGTIMIMGALAYKGGRDGERDAKIEERVYNLEYQAKEDRSKLAFSRMEWSEKIIISTTVDKANLEANIKQVTDYKMQKDGNIEFFNSLANDKIESVYKLIPKKYLK